MVVMFMLHMLKLRLQAVLVHGGADLRSVELRPRGGDESGMVVEALEQLNGCHYLLLGSGVGAAEDDEVGVLDLVVEELAEVAHVHAALAGVDDGDLRADDRALDAGDGGGDVGELADAGGFDDDTVGRVLVHDLLEGLGEVADQRAADTAGVHLGYLNARVPEEASVDGDLAELILDENELFALVCLGYQLADEGSFARAEKSGKNVYLCHGQSLHV